MYWREIAVEPQAGTAPWSSTGWETTNTGGKDALARCVMIIVEASKCLKIIPHTAQNYSRLLNKSKTD